MSDNKKKQGALARLANIYMHSATGESAVSCDGNTADGTFTIVRHNARENVISMNLAELKSLELFERNFNLEDFRDEQSGQLKTSISVPLKSDIDLDEMLKKMAVLARTATTQNIDEIMGGVGLGTPWNKGAVHRHGEIFTSENDQELGDNPDNVVTEPTPTITFPTSQKPAVGTPTTTNVEKWGSTSLGKWHFDF